MLAKDENILGLSREEILSTTFEDNIVLANEIAQMLTESDDPKVAIKVRGLDGQEIPGYAFGDVGDVIVTANFVATLKDDGEIDRFLLRR